MSQYIDGPTKSYAAGEKIAKHLRVKLDSNGLVMIAGLADRDIGTAETPALEVGDDITVRLRTASGTCKMIASEAMDAGSTVYTKASGKVQDTAEATSFVLGTAQEAAGADGDVIEVLRNTHGDTAVGSS